MALCCRIPQLRGSPGTGKSLSFVRALNVTSEADFNRLSIAVRDFDQAVAFAEETARHQTGTLVYEALIFTVIVSYCRPFSPNEKGKAPAATSQLKLEEFSPLTPEESALHEKCKDLRNQALAHSEYKHNPTRLDAASGVIASRPFSLLSHAPDIKALSALAKKIADECHHKRADYVRSRAL